MKRVLSVLISILMLLLLAACQPTPDEQIVMKKDTERMVERAAAQENGTPVSMLGIPDERYTYEASDASGMVQIRADAEIILPDAERLPIVRVGMGKFTEQDAENLYNLLCDGATPIAPDAPLPKSYYQKIVHGLTELRQSGNLDKYDSIEELDAAIAEVMKQVDQAPANVQAIEPKFSFVSKEHISEIRISCLDSDFKVSTLSVMNSADGSGSSRADFIRNIQDRAAYSALIAGGLAPTLAFEQTLSPYFVSPKMSGQEAAGIANGAMEKLGLTDFVCTGKRMAALYNPGVDAIDAPRRGMYEFMFTRGVNGAAITFTNDEGMASSADPNAAARPWPYERLRMFIDDEGIFALQWDSPYTVTEIQNEGATLLPFDKIAEVFELMIVVKNEQPGNSAIAAYQQTIEIKEIRLGLMRVKEKNVRGSGVLVPVWDFFGTQTFGNITIGQDGYQSLLTINAVDGGIIDRELGY